MLKLPKGLKKKKKGKKSKRKGEDELFTEEELKKYKQEKQRQAEAGQSTENEEWSKFKDLTTGIDSVLKKTQGDLDRIKSTSFFQRIPAGPKEVDSLGKEVTRSSREPAPAVRVPETTVADFAKVVEEEDRSDLAVTDTESEDDQDDIFDTSYVDAVERGEVKLAYVPDSPENEDDDGLFDTSHVDVLIRGQENKANKGKKTLDIGVAVEVLTGRIDNVTITTKRHKRVIPGDLLLDSGDTDALSGTTSVAPTSEVATSILDTEADIPLSYPIDLSVSLHTSLLQHNKDNWKETNKSHQEIEIFDKKHEAEEIDEFTLLATESLEASAEVTKLEKEVIDVKPVVEESWSAFEANKNSSVFAESIIEDQIEVDPYLDEVDPFDTSFADSLIPLEHIKNETELVDDDDDDDFDPRADEVKVSLNNRRKSTVRIHLTDPAGLRESITSDDVYIKEGSQNIARDLLGGSTTDLSQLGDSLLDPVDVNDSEIADPFDTTLVDKIVAPGKTELKLLERELIDSNPVYRVDSDPDFDPRADEAKEERRASRPENLIVNKSVVFDITEADDIGESAKGRSGKPLTPYYTKELSISEDIDEEIVSTKAPRENLIRTKSDEDIAAKTENARRRHSEYPTSGSVRFSFKAEDLLERQQENISIKVLTPSGPQISATREYTDPFDTSIATDIAPSRTELKLLAREFSCEDEADDGSEQDLLAPTDDIFQARALSPTHRALPREPQALDDPFDTSIAGDLRPGRTELRLLETELLN